MNKKYYITAGLLSLMLGFQMAHAASNITGDAYAQIFGTVLMTDPDNPSAPIYGVTIEDIENPQSENCDHETQTCNLRGFSWSDVTGWTYWDGIGEDGDGGLREELGGISNFPDGYVAKATYKGNLGGFIWGEKYGWVQLSACAGITDESDCNDKDYCQWNDINSPASCDVDKIELIADIETQDEEDWGVYIDFCNLKNETACSTAAHCHWEDADPTTPFCQINNPATGYPLKGYALSEKLGWIKFNREGGESELNGVYTTWSPDLTPPRLRAQNPDNTWIPANNTGSTTLIWEDFAIDNDSARGIDVSNSMILVSMLAGASADDCVKQSVLNSNPPEIHSTLASPPVSGAVDLDLLMMNQVKTPENGFCKYQLEGTLYNGSGFGLYVGDLGKAQAAADWGWNGSDPDDILPNVIRDDPVTLYVRAGEFDQTESNFDFFDYSTPGTTVSPAIADGINYNMLRFIPRDGSYSNNPIIDVEADMDGDTGAGVPESDWVRKVEMDFIYGNNSDPLALAYNYDKIEPLIPFFAGIAPPFSVEGSFAPYDLSESEFDFPLASSPASDGAYLTDTTPYAPSIGGNQLDMKRIELVLEDIEIPAISPSASPIDTGFDDNALAAPHAFAFQPALETSGDLDIDVLTIGVDTTAEYDLENLSTNTELTDYAIDHLMLFADGEAASLEVRAIHLNPDLDGTTGQTNPDSAVARYLTFKPGLQDEQDTAFHSTTGTYHDPSYNMTVVDSNGLDNEGVFMATGDLFFADDAECKTNPAIDCVIPIDRNDRLTLNLPDSALATYNFNFRPNHISGGSITDATTFTMSQYLAYTTEEIKDAIGDIMNIYRGNSELGPYEVKSIGLGTSGPVSGSQTYESVSGRDLETITTTSSADLRKEIRRNAAILTRTMTACPADTNPIMTSAGALPTSGTCILMDDINKTILAYYSGSGVVRLATTNPVTIPTGYKYTIILDEGADLSIENNIYYQDTNSSLGIILLSDSNDQGANVYIDPAPTNLVGLLYAEGSLLASPDAGTSFYYNGDNSSNALKNQLYWQGSIASRNTIGGGPNVNIPEGVDCNAWSDDQSCAQAYDLDFLRRFTTVTKGTVTFAPLGSSFSGGGYCDPAIESNPGCIPGSLPTTVTISSGSINLSNSKSLDTFFIERDNRPVPPGFTSSGGLTSSQEIR
jgi:hypothetical protein